MTHAYSELYLNDAQKVLSNAFDYAINDCKISPDLFANFFIQSNIAQEFETGNPSILSGKSGIEIAQEIIKKTIPDEPLPKAKISFTRSKEYWAGWSLVYYQWYSRKRFKDIFERIPLSEIITMYNPFHEMDLSNFVEEIEKRYKNIVLTPKLKKIREARGISQQELSRLSGVSLRSIQLYEQRVNDIDKAQAQTLYKLARVLACDIEDLLENPEDFKD